MIYFHGSPVGNLRTLLPNVSNHKDAFVYFSSKRSVALLYTVRKNWYPYGFAGENRIVEYTEYYLNALGDIYSGKTGYIYEYEGEGIIENPTNIYCAYVSRLPVSPTNEEVIEDVFLEIKKLEKQGLIIIKRYEDLSEREQIGKSKMILNEISDEHLLEKKNDYAHFIREKFPKEWELAMNSRRGN
jgi:hypothetical protein